MNESKLLRTLREAISAPTNLRETSTSAIVGNYYGKPKKSPKKRLHGIDAVDKLSKRAGDDETLGEVASAFLESRSRVRSLGFHGSERYKDILEELDIALEMDMPVEIINEIHEQVIPILKEDVGLSGSPCSGECEAVHKKFVKKLESEFKVEAARWDPVAEGVYIYFNAKDTCKLSDSIMELREFADDSDYILIKKGSTEDAHFRSVCCDESLWVFVYDENHHTEDLGEIEEA